MRYSPHFLMTVQFQDRSRVQHGSSYYNSIYLSYYSFTNLMLHPGHLNFPGGQKERMQHAYLPVSLTQLESFTW